METRKEHIGFWQGPSPVEVIQVDGEGLTDNLQTPGSVIKMFPKDADVSCESMTPGPSSISVDVIASASTSGPSESVGTCVDSSRDQEFEAVLGRSTPTEARKVAATGQEKGKTSMCYPKPWSQKIARMRVTVPPKDVPNRVAQVRKDKEVMQQFMCKTPYVEFTWKDSAKDERLLALLDSGADWSLIDESLMSDRERALITASEVQGKGVCGEDVPIVGEVWRSLEIGGLVVDDHRFIVVRNMITNVILGSDFWSRISPMTFDFEKQVICLGPSMVKVPLFYGDSRSEGSKNCQLTMKNTQVIPPMTEAIVEGKAKGVQAQTTYLLEPKLGEDSRVQAPYSVVKSRDKNQALFVRVANVSQEPVTISEGHILGNLNSNVSVLKGTIGNDHSNTRAKVVDWRDDLVVGDNLSVNQKNQLIDTLGKYENIFYKDGELPLVQVGVEHSVRLQENAAPVACRPRRLSKDEEQEVRKEIDTLFKQGLIRHSNSPWASPIVCARRADGSLRLAIDYRLVNSVSYPATLHPIPLIEDLLDRLSDAKYFSVLDAKSGYHQMPLRAEDTEVTAFVTPWAHLEWSERTPFGLKGAGYSFQRMMAVILGESNFTEALCYLDDILIWGTTWEEHMNRLNSVLSRVQAAGLALSIKKCKFGVQEVHYLGSVIKEGMVSISNQRVHDLRSLPTPSTVRELRSVIGAFSFVQRWLPGVSEVMKPLHKGILGKPHSKIKWTVEMNQSFNMLKKLVANATALKIPDPEKEFTLITDCSAVGAGGVLAQQDDYGNGLGPVAYFHHTLTAAEQKYGVTDKELLAVVLAMKRFRVYLCKKFNLVTDHSALKWLKSLNINDEKGRRGRWMEFINQFEVKVFHKPGKSPEMSMADYLSRIVTAGLPEESGPLIKPAPAENKFQIFSKKRCSDVPEISVAVIKEAQSSCPIMGELISLFAKEGERPLDKTVTEVIDQRVLERLFVDDRGLLMLRFNGGKHSNKHPFGVKEKNRIVIPRSLVNEVLQLSHCGGLSGHMGQDRTWKRARDSFYWKNMKQDVDRYVAECERCGRNKHSTHPNIAPYQETDLPHVPLDHLQIDYAGPFKAAQSHPYRYALQIQDVLSRFVRLIPCVEDTAKEAVQCLMEQWVCIFGVPSTINSDQGTHFTSDLFEGICKVLGIKHKLAAPKHPESQGQVERQNQLLAQVRCVCDNDAEKWPEAISRVAFAHNSAENKTTGISPLALLTGQAARDPAMVWLRDQSSAPPIAEPPTYYHKMLEEKERVILTNIEEARRRTHSAQLARIERQKVRGKPYKVGDVVRMKLDSAEILKRGKKMAYRYSGKLEVIDVLKGGWTYRLKPLGWKGREKIRHYNDLKDVLQHSDQAHSSEDENVVSRKPAPQSLNMKQITKDSDSTDAIAHRGQDGQLPRNGELRRSSRQRSAPNRLVITDMRAKKYEEKTDIVEESEDEEGSTSSISHVFDLSEASVGSDWSSADSESYH